MRHNVAHRKLGRNRAHRAALLKNLSKSLFTHERLQTTLQKAKELRSYAEKLITLAKKDSLHARRLAFSRLGDHVLVKKLFDDLAPVYAQRPGGYTRIYRLGERRGDNGQMALIELVDRAPKAAAAGDKKSVAAEAKPAKVKAEKPAKAKAEASAAKPAKKKKAE